MINLVNFGGHKVHLHAENGGHSKGDPTRSEWNGRYGQNFVGGKKIVQMLKMESQNRGTYLLTLKEGVPASGGL